MPSLRVKFWRSQLIIDSNQHPEKNLYFIGAKLIELLSKDSSKSPDVYQLHTSYNKKNTKISLDYLLLGLDWLYLLGLTEVDDSGRIKLCS